MTRYDEDFYAWSRETAQALLERRFEDIDIEHAADEILDLSKSEVRAVDSRLTQILTHLLKIRYQPERRTRSWDLTIAEQRERLEQLLSDSPSLRGCVKELVHRAYRTARLKASRQTGIDLEQFPIHCPFTLEEIVGE